MTKDIEKLPYGVSPDNSSTSTTPSYTVLDMATPKFVEDPTRTQERSQAEFGGAFEQENAKPQPSRNGTMELPPAFRQMALITAIAALLGVIALGAMGLQGNKMPLCETLPDWNQYNCRQG